MLFQKRKKEGEFQVLQNGEIYLDTSCQTLRPRCVRDAQQKYLTSYNACGGRVKYPWGERVDTEVSAVRTRILKFLKKSEKEYSVVFTLNTTYGLNLLMSQIQSKGLERIVTTDKEHNSVFLPTMTWAKRYDKERIVLDRTSENEVSYGEEEIKDALIVLQTTSNIDGAHFEGIGELVDRAHAGKSIVILDGAQSMGHNPELLHGVDYDALCFSGHKMYGPSIGVMVVKKTLIEEMDTLFIGGGTVSDVTSDEFTLLDGKEIGARLELGLQNWEGIIGLGAAIDWVSKQKIKGEEEKLASLLYDGISGIPGAQMISPRGTSIVTFYSEHIDAHTLAILLGKTGIMARSGYFCCHYYLKNKYGYPPLLRLSLGAQITSAEIERVLEAIKYIHSSLT